MNFGYNGAPRCTVDDQKAIIPTEDAADAFIQASSGDLVKQRCTVGNGWHLTDARHEAFLDRYHSTDK